MNKYDPDLPLLVSSIATDRSHDVELSSVDKTYLESVYDEFYVPIAYDKTGDLETPPGLVHPDGVKSLYDSKGLVEFHSYDSYGILSSLNTSAYNLNARIGTAQIRLIIPQSLADSIPVRAGQISLLQIGSKTFSARIRCVASKFPGFAFTAYTITEKSPIITSHEDYQKIRDALWTDNAYSNEKKGHIKIYLDSIPQGSSYTVPKTGLCIKLEDNVEENIRLRLVNDIQGTIKGKFTLLIDVTSFVKTLTTAMSFLNLAFVLISAIALLLCFFYTLIAFVANVKENLLEFGVLRAIGLTKIRMHKLYILEALSIILAATILGIMVGSVAAILVLDLFGLLVELPMKFMVPTVLLVVIIALTLAIGILSSQVAVNNVKDRQISAIIKKFG